MALEKITKGAIGMAALFTVAITSPEEANACVGKPGPADIQIGDEHVILDPAKPGVAAKTPSGVEIRVLPGYKFEVSKPDGSKKVMQGYGRTRSFKPQPVECGDMYLKE